MDLSAFLDGNGMTDETFAALVGVDRSTVSRWRSGTRRPRIEQIWLIEDKTGGAVTASDFRPSGGSTAADASESDIEESPMEATATTG